MKIHNLKNYKGFTLVETMVAVFILSFSTAVFMNVVASGFFSARYAKNETIANFLLQEAIDYVRNDRDTRIILSNSTVPEENWASFRSSYDMCSELYNGCYLDVVTGDKIKCSEANIGTQCPAFYFHEDSEIAFYDYVSDDGTLTTFRRNLLVYPNESNPNDEIFVKAYVSWENGGVTKTRSLETSFLRWQQ